MTAQLATLDNPVQVQQMEQMFNAFSKVVQDFIKDITKKLDEAGASLYEPPKLAKGSTPKGIGDEAWDKTKESAAEALAKAEAAQAHLNLPKRPTQIV